MIFKSQLITQGSGSVGGSTVFNSRSGLAMRARAIPVDPNSPDQQTRRTVFGDLSARWATLTDAQREAWSTYAANVTVTNRLGDQIHLSGHMMYVRNNAARQAAALAVVDDGPTNFNALEATTIEVDVSAAASQITVAWDDAVSKWDKQTGGGLGVYVSTDKSVGREFYKGPYLLAGAILGDTTTPPTSPDTSLTSPYTHTEDNHVFARVIAYAPDGRISDDQLLGPMDVQA